jgi:hypothetical protein
VKEAQKHVAGAVDLLNKYVIAPNDPGATDTTRKASQIAQEASDWLKRSTDQTTAMEKVGGWGESVAEVFAPEMWLGKAAEGLSAAERIAEMGKIAKVVEKYPGLQPVVAAGVKALKGATAVAGTGAKLGTQAYIESGGDKDAAETAALTGMVLHGALGTAAAGGKAIIKGAAGSVAALKAATAAAEAAPGKFGQGATDVLQAAFDRLGVADKAAPVSDYGQAAKQLGSKASDIYDAADQATEGRWRKANAAIQAAKASGDSAQEAAARANMEELMSGFDDTSYGQLAREATDRARDAFHDHYTLDKIHDSLVKSFDFGTPETAADRGGANSFDGKKLFNQLTELERDKGVGRERMVELMGEKGLNSLYDLADTAKNPAKNQRIASILQEIVNRAHTVGSKVGWATGMLGSMIPGGWAKTAGPGYAAGAIFGGGEASAEKLLGYAATKPRLTSLLNYAAKHNISTRYAATLAGEAFRQEMESDQQKQGAKPNAGN